MKANNNDPNFRPSYTDKKGRKVKGFWRLKTEKGYKTLTKFGAPSTNKNKADRALAQKAKEKYLLACDVPSENQTILVFDVFNVYLEKHLSKKPQATQDVIEPIIKRFLIGRKTEQNGIKPFKGFGKLKWSELKFSHFETFAEAHTNWIDTEEIKSGGKRTAFRYLSAAMNFAASNEGDKIISDDNPLKGVKLGSCQARTDTMTNEELALFLSKANKSLATIVEALADHGARPSELCVATDKHLKEKNGCLCIELQPHEWKNGLKTGKKRVIIIKDKWKEYVLAQKGFLFRNHYGNKLTADTIGAGFKRVLDATPEINQELVPYSLRHTYITKSIKSGMSITILAQATGTSTKMIEKFYNHIIEDYSTLAMVHTMIEQMEQVAA